jgi:hypothetical protein
MGDVIDKRRRFQPAREIPEPKTDKALIDWPRLDEIGLTEAQVSQRESGIGGSDSNIILSSNKERIVGLWHEKRGVRAPVDLTNNLPVMLGSWTEAFNRLWFEKITGKRVDELHLAITCNINPWRRCTLDGYLTESAAIWEAKHTNAFTTSDDVLERYMPQLQHNMAVAKVDRAILSVIFGNHKFEFFEVASDWIYQIELLQAEADFWDCVVTGREPVPAVPPTPPKPVGVREVCLESNNRWAAAAADWCLHRQAAKLHASAANQLKELVEPDVARAFGHGVEAKRSKAGSITIRELP